MANAAPKAATPVAAPKNVTPSATASTPTPASANAVAMTQERVRKITSKMFKAIAIGKEHGVKIAGIVRVIKKRPSVLDSSKEFCAFIGDFRLQMGNQLFVSNELILPQYPESVIENGFNAAFEGDKSGVAPSVTFAMLIYRKDDSANTKNARGFTWELDEIKQIAPVSIENDPLLKLLA